MRWDDLKFFLAVARTGQLTTAAKGLKVDNATVARRIRALETALDARLFDRNPKGYSLTEVGQRLLPSAEAMETTTLQAQAQLQGRDESLEGVVRLGAPDGFGRSEEHTSELQSLMRISYAVLCLTKKNNNNES